MYSAWIEPFASRGAIPKLLAIVLTVMCAAAGATSQPSDRKSADGETLPDVSFQEDASFTLSNSKATGGVRSIEAALGKDPLKIGHRILNARTSAKAVEHRLTKREDDSVTSATNDPQVTETYHATKEAVVTKLENEWFTFGLAGEDITGIDLENGVVSRVTLIFLNPVAAKRVTSRLPDSAGLVSFKQRAGNGFIRLDAEVTDAGWYYIQHPDTERRILDALSSHDIVEGMDLEQATASVGDPQKITGLDNHRTAYWIVGSEIVVAQFTGDKIASVEHRSPSSE
jgi:hypothetical protein